ncbi:MAG TPA: hypothetical protein VKI17_12345 [Gemmataceae bacterium]|nr:hypothetical protein [Gemmataceae bacterium]
MDEPRQQLASQLERIGLACLRLRRAVAGGRYDQLEPTPVQHAQTLIDTVPPTLARLEALLERKAVPPVPRRRL